MLTRSLAREWARRGLSVNALCPGYIDTEINHHHWQTEQGQKLVQMLPRKRVGSPQDLDALLVMLASDQSHFVNGAVIALVTSDRNAGTTSASNQGLRRIQMATRQLGCGSASHSGSRLRELRTRVAMSARRASGR